MIPEDWLTKHLLQVWIFTCLTVWESKTPIVYVKLRHNIYDWYINKDLFFINLFILVHSLDLKNANQRNLIKKKKNVHC